MAAPRWDTGALRAPEALDEGSRVPMPSGANLSLGRLSIMDLAATSRKSEQQCGNPNKGSRRFEAGK